MKIISWNINGLRSIIKKGLSNFINEQNADVIHLQEIKITSDAYNLLDLEKQVSSEFHIHSHFSIRKKGYSGLLTLTKIKPVNVIYGIGNSEYDVEGRVLALEYSKYFLVNVYFPHASRDLSRLPFKLKFNDDFLSFVKKLNKPVVISGDFNVAHTHKDIARAKQNEGNAGYTKQERNFFTKFLGNGYIDTFRYLNHDEIKYTWWLQGFSARKRNVGWRIDYNVISNSLEKKLINADIMTNTYGSDHCPTVVELNL